MSIQNISFCEDIIAISIRFSSKGSLSSARIYKDMQAGQDVLFIKDTW